MDKKSMSRPSVTRGKTTPTNKPSQEQLLSKYKPMPIVPAGFKNKKK